jgi:CheY-like chemotaxis protein
MVYGLIKQHGGRIEVESAPGRGTTVLIYLPAVADPGADPVELVPVSSQAAPARGRGTILLVEDEAPLRRSTQRILERYGYRVLPAADGVDALVEFRRWTAEIDLIITDVVMPRMGGAALLAELGRLGSRVPVLITSGYASNDQRGELRLPAGVPFLAKPWDATELLCLVQAVMAKNVLRR